MRIVAFDFDGTITKKDTLIEFIKFSRGRKAFYIGFFKYAPLLFLMKIHLYSNWLVKQKIFAHFYAKESYQNFKAICKSFFQCNKCLVYSQAIKCIENHKKEGDTVVIVTASIEDWVIYFAQWLGVDDVIGTKIEVVDGNLSGQFFTKNCYGQEKVNRLIEKYPNRNEYELIVYGDSRGDKELLSYANQKIYKPFSK